MSELRKDLIEDVMDIWKEYVPQKPIKGDPKGHGLADLFFWQTLNKFAEKECKAAWERAQNPNSETKFLAIDDELRKAGAGNESIIVESKKFSLVVKITAGQRRFDLDTFCDALTKKFKLDKGELLQLAETCKPESAPQLSKRVVEAGHANGN